MEKRLLKLSFVLAILIGLSSCWKQNNPPSKVEDPSEESERIYGDLDGPPKQSLLEYAVDPSHIARADAIRQKLYPK